MSHSSEDFIIALGNARLKVSSGAKLDRCEQDKKLTQVNIAKINEERGKINRLRTEATDFFKEGGPECSNCRNKKLNFPTFEYYFKHSALAIFDQFNNANIL